MAEKVTKMLIKVDLQCSRCYRKIKKILCKFPQIRDQTYDEKKNAVSITVVCCSPEKIRQKIICKGGKIVQSIEILLDKEKPKPAPVPPKIEPAPVLGYPAVGVCCCPPWYCGGPCCCGRRLPVMCYYASRCDYFSEENATARTLM